MHEIGLNISVKGEEYYAIFFFIRSRVTRNRFLIAHVLFCLNFSHLDFLHRAKKLTILQNIKSLQNQNLPYQLQFPKHPKHRKNDQLSVVYKQSLNTVEIETTILQAFKHAQELVSKLDVNILLEENNLFELKTLSIETYKNLKKSNRLIDSATSNSVPDSDLVNNENDGYNSSNSDEENYYEDLSTDKDDDESDNTLKTNRADFSGMRILNSIDQAQRNSYFEVEINGNKKFLHKQTACWLVTESNHRLSSDRVSRVKQTSR